jgi:murein DD-endopeptidase MepM/ murein hydrolase activator NlpD
MSINQYMKSIIMDQHVERRNRGISGFQGSFFRKTGASAARKPYKYIDGVKQRPARVKRRHKRKSAFSFNFFSTLSSRPGEKARPSAESSGVKEPRYSAFDRLIDRLFNPGGPSIRTMNPEKPKKHRKPGKSGFAPLRKPLQFSVTPIFALAGIAVFSVLTLNWKVPASAAAIAPAADEVIQANLASYAGLAPLSAAAFDVENEAIPLDLMESFHWESYTVRSGDSVSRIAAAHSVSMDAIIASNGITNARRLREGMTIRVPNMDGIPYTVKKGDNLSGISGAMGVPLEAILDANDIESDAISAGVTLFIPGARMRSEDLRQALGELFIYPIRGRLTSPFGWRHDPINGARRHHAAINLAAPTGTPIKAAMDGRVSTVGLNSVYGKYIIITHSSGLQTWYAHMSATSVAQGAYVRQGAKIGEVGSTGYSTGPHLHFAVYKNGKPVNPLELLN